jgi:hypothetical protein
VLHSAEQGPGRSVVNDRPFNVLFLCTGSSEELESRIRIFTSLPIRSLDRIRLQERLDAIGS